MEPAAPSLKQFLLKGKPAAVLLALKDTSISYYPSKLAQISGASYVYVTTWLTKLEAAGWVKFERKGRQKAVVLTEKGMAAAQALEELVRKIEPKPSVPSAPAAQAPQASQEKQ